MLAGAGVTGILSHDRVVFCSMWIQTQSSFFSPKPPPPPQLGIAKISLAAESLASGNIKGNKKHRLRRVADENRKE